MDKITVSVASISIRKNIDELGKRLHILAERANYFEISFESEKAEFINFYHKKKLHQVNLQTSKVQVFIPKCW